MHYRIKRGSLFWLLTIMLVSVIFLNTMYNKMSSQYEVFNTKQKFKIHVPLKPNWIVVTTVSPPNEDVKYLASLPDWQLVVVADKKTPRNWSFPNAIFLDKNLQMQLGYRIIKKLPWNSYSRKNIGYLFAIQHGAKYIFDTDDDNRPLSPLFKSFVREDTIRALIYKPQSNSTMFNPYSHFGHPTLWPRGFPMDSISTPNEHLYYSCDQLKTPLIQQGLVNGDPDVDAIFRLSRKPSRRRLNITFDSNVPAVVLPVGVFAPFNSQNTFFHHKAFWGLLLPSTTTFRVSDIWRGYWVQRLLWLISGAIGFFPPNTYQIRNPHAYLKDFNDEIELYKKADELVKFLKEWTCIENSFFHCVMSLSSDMEKNGFWDKEDVLLTSAWISDLRDIGYEEPAINNFSLCFKDSDFKVYFHPKQLGDIPINNIEEYESHQRSKNQIIDNVNRNNFLNELCFGKKSSASYTWSDKAMGFSNILLVIVLNFPYYDVIPVIDSLYRPHFPNIAYCGYINVPQPNDPPETLPTPRVYNVTFIGSTNTAGFFGYECAIKAIQVGYKVKGYFMLGDDVLLNVWNVKKFDTSKVWHLKLSPNYYSIWNSSYFPSWFWWDSLYGQKALIDSWEQMIRLKNSTNLNKNNIHAINSYFKNLLDKSGSTDIYTRNNGDIYYIPERFSNLFSIIGQIFRRNKVFLEIAVPTLLLGIASANETEMFSGTDLWNGDRWYEPLKYFNKEQLYLHPVKFSLIVNKDKKFITSFCYNYIAELVTYELS